MMRWAPLLLGCLFLAGGALQATAQPRASVEGVVRDETGQPLSGAAVILVDADRGDATDNDGRYSIDAPPGTYTLKASFVGFRTASSEVTLRAGATVTQAFTLAPDLLLMDETVTTATFNPFAKLESSVAITTLDARDIETQAPQSVADLLKAAPGFYVESSGGVGENNLFARGLPADGSYRYVALQEDGTSIYEVSELDFANPDNFLRVDETIERMEAVRGGSASTFTSNTPGGVVNFVTRTGSPNLSGRVKLTTAAHGLYRGDLNIGGALGDPIRFNVGGFYRHDEGLRDPGFTANRGGQLKANLTWLHARGYVRLFGKYLNDRTIFYLPVPYTNQQAPTSIPGFDLGTGTLTTEAAATITVPAPDGRLVTRDLRDGIHPIVRTGGAEILLDLGRGWTLHNITRLSVIDHSFSAIVSLNNPVAARTYADSVRARANAQRSLGATGYRYRRASDGTVIDDPTALNGNGLVVETGWWYNEKPLSTLLNDLRLTKTWSRHALTASGYASRFTSEDFRHWHDLLSEVNERPARLDLELVNDSGTLVGQATQNGFRRLGSNYVNHDGTGTLFALHLGDHWSISDHFRLDIGTRLQTTRFTGSVETPTRTNLDEDIATDAPATLFDDRFQTGSGRFLDYDYTFNEWALSVGANYRFDDRLAFFVRGSRGFRMPTFDRWIASAQDGTPGLERGVSETVVQAEGGVKYSAPMFALFASGFFSRLSDIPFNDQVVTPGGGITVIQNFGSSRTIGTELEMILRPAPRLEIAMRTTVQNPVFTKLKFVDPEDGELDFAGNQVKRIPLLLFSFKPTYQHHRFSVHATWEYVGDRFANNRNSFVLPAYSIVDLGVSVALFGVTLSADALNLFNAHGLTEGNPRIDESLSAEEAAAIDVLMGRPVLPRALKMALAYTF